MSFDTMAILVTVLLSGLISYYSSYVILRHLLIWHRDKGRLLPLHVWLIATSYNLLVIATLTTVRDFHASFWLYTPALFLGVVAMHALSKHMRKVRRG